MHLASGPEVKKLPYDFDRHGSMEMQFHLPVPRWIIFVREYRRPEEVEKATLPLDVGGKPPCVGLDFHEGT